MSVTWDHWTLFLRLFLVISVRIYFWSCTDILVVYMLLSLSLSLSLSLWSANWRFRKYWLFVCYWSTLWQTHCSITALFWVHAFLNSVLKNSWPSSRGKNRSKMSQVTMFTVCSVKAFISSHRTKLVATVAMQYKTFEHCNCNDCESPCWRIIGWYCSRLLVSLLWM